MCTTKSGSIRPFPVKSGSVLFMRPEQVADRPQREEARASKCSRGLLPSRQLLSMAGSYCAPFGMLGLGGSGKSSSSAIENTDGSGDSCGCGSGAKPSGA